MEVLVSMFTLLLLTNFARCTFDADDITDLRNRLKVLEEELINLKATCYRPEKTMRGRTRLLEVTEVAFSAILDSHSQDTHTHNQPVKFEHVYSNAGLGYSNSTGIFRVPTDGLYQLYASVAVDGDNAIHAYMERNGNRLCAATATHYSTGSCMVIVHLNEGDTVWVREAFGTLVRGGGLSTFAGIRLGH